MKIILVAIWNILFSIIAIFVAFIMIEVISIVLEPSPIRFAVISVVAIITAAFVALPFLALFGVIPSPISTDDYSFRKIAGFIILLSSIILFLLFFEQARQILEIFFNAVERCSASLISRFRGLEN